MVTFDDGARGTFADNDIVRTDCDRTKKNPVAITRSLSRRKMIQRLQVKRNEKGFTLIELLIVIIVLGILAAIVVFAVGSTRKDAVQASCKTDFKSVELSAEAMNTKNGIYPATDPVGGATPTNGALLKTMPSSADYTFNYTQTGSGTGYTLTVNKLSTPTATAVLCTAL
jgi:general secretion pathway protein G